MNGLSKPDRWYLRLGPGKLAQPVRYDPNLSCSESEEQIGCKHVVLPHTKDLLIQPKTATSHEKEQNPYRPRNSRMTNSPVIAGEKVETVEDRLDKPCRQSLGNEVVERGNLGYS